MLAANPNNPFPLDVDVTARILSAPRESYWDTVFGRLVAGLRGQLTDGVRVETAFVILQVVVAFVFGVVAGHVRVRTDSVVGPVLMHSTMNFVAVL